MQINLKQDTRIQKIERALKNNLRKRKLFQNKINKKIKENKK